MKVTVSEKQQKIRRQAAEILSVYDQHSGKILGRVLDMSARGMKLDSEQPPQVRRIYYCRIPFRKDIDGNHEVFFDAECRWCRQSPDTGAYNSGFFLRFPTPRDAAIVQKIIYAWMTHQAELMNARYSRPA